MIAMADADELRLQGGLKPSVGFAFGVVMLSA